MALTFSYKSAYFARMLQKFIKAHSFRRSVNHSVHTVSLACPTIYIYTHVFYAILNLISFSRLEEKKRRNRGAVDTKAIKSSARSAYIYTLNTNTHIHTRPRTHTMAAILREPEWVINVADFVICHPARILSHGVNLREYIRARKRIKNYTRCIILERSNAIRVTRVERELSSALN